MEVCTQWWNPHSVKCQTDKTSRKIVCWSIRFLHLPTGRDVSVRVDIFGSLAVTMRGNSFTFLFPDRFSRRADIYAVTAEDGTAEGTADVVSNRYIPTWGCSVALLSENGNQVVARLAQAVYPRLEEKFPRAPPTPTNVVVSSALTTHGPNARNRWQ